MQQLLNFGPSEQTVSEREEIVKHALIALENKYKKPSSELLAMYDRYIAKEVDLYTISQLVYREHSEDYNRFIRENTK